MENDGIKIIHSKSQALLLATWLESGGFLAEDLNRFVSMQDISKRLSDTFEIKFSCQEACLLAANRFVERAWARRNRLEYENAIRKKTEPIFGWRLSQSCIDYYHKQGYILDAGLLASHRVELKTRPFGLF